MQPPSGLADYLFQSRSLIIPSVRAMQETTRGDHETTFDGAALVIGKQFQFNIGPFEFVAFITNREVKFLYFLINGKPQHFMKMRPTWAVFAKLILVTRHHQGITGLEYKTNTRSCCN